MKVCTIIVSYNFEKWISPCLESLQNSTISNQIVVIDNASTDSTCNIITTQYPNVHLITNKDNLGFGKANNIGFRYAIDHGFEYVFLLNQDAWIDNNTLQKLIESSQSNPDCGIISPIHLNGAGDNLDFGFATYSSLKNKSDIANIKQATECEFINAAMWLIPISVLKKVGAFAPIFPHYGEDVNYAQRVRFHKYKICFVKDAYGYHDREFRVVSKEKYFYTEYIYFLTEATNIKYSCIKAFGYSFLATIKKSLQSLIAGKANDSLKYISIAYKLLTKFNHISDTRHKTLNEDGPFL